MNAPSEFLTPEEVTALTGHRTRDAQIAWLDECGWPYFTNAARRPIIGRWYVRLRLAGITPTESGLKRGAQQPNWEALEQP